LKKTRIKPLRVTLVNPPFQYFPGIRSGTESYTRPPLGIAYLAAYLRRNAQAPLALKLIDCEAEGFVDSDTTAAAIMQGDPDVVGFSVVTGTFSEATLLAEKLKKIKPGIRIVAGGPHVTALPEEVMPGIDAKIIGEGELSLLEYLQEAVLGGSEREIAGVVRFSDGELVSRGKARAMIENLDDIPIPARDLLPGSYFHSYPYPGVRAFTTMFTSRGCPYNCNFCGNETLWGRRARYHSLDRTFEEIDQVTAAGVNLIFFDDDTFTANKKRVLAITEYIARHHPDLRWICHIRADTVDRPLLAEMKKSGCVEVQVGVESGDQEVLRNTDKMLDIEKVRTTFRSLHEIGINSWGTFILGNDGESTETIRRTISLACEIDPTYASFIVLLPFPGTRIFEKYKKQGYITTFDWGRYSWHGQPVIDLPRLSAADLIAWRKKAFLRFYLRPGKLLQSGFSVLRSLSLREMKRNFRAWQTLVIPQSTDKK
jgi:radical SAM superfamily enzyme YgiQ (UPF0313 family)